MMPELKTIGREVGKILAMIARYFFVCGVIMLATMSLVTGKFPPPVVDVYSTLKQVQENLDMGKATSQFAKAKKEQSQILTDLENMDRDVDGRKVAGTVNLPATDQEKIKALEYEVAVLKAKLARSQWETRQAQAAVTAVQQQPAQSIQSEQSQSAQQASAHR